VFSGAITCEARLEWAGRSGKAWRAAVGPPITQSEWMMYMKDKGKNIVHAEERWGMRKDKYIP